MNDQELNDLRARVLRGEEVDNDELVKALTALRTRRSSASVAAEKPKSSLGTGVAKKPVDLDAILANALKTA